MKNIKPLLCVVASVGALLPAACTQYLDRKDTVAFSAGNAVETNVATHVINPWPPRASNTRIALDGERMQKAVERYRQGRVTDPGCARPQSTNASNTAPASSGGTPCAQPAPQPQSRTGGSAAPAAASGEGTR
jgi:hypothetical protein